MKQRSHRYKKSIHAAIPAHLYEFLFRTAAQWAIDGDEECAIWFFNELHNRDYQCAKDEYNSLRGDPEFIAQYRGLPCVSCGKPSTTIDHVIPLTHGGTNEPSNLQPMCNACNSKKSDKLE